MLPIQCSAQYDRAARYRAAFFISIRRRVSYFALTNADQLFITAHTFTAVTVADARCLWKDHTWAVIFLCMIPVVRPEAAPPEIAFEKRDATMALYKHQGFLAHTTDAAFDKTHHPGYPAPYAGIYRCTSCGHEIAIADGHTLPPQNHHQHQPDDGPIMWQMIVHPQSVQ